MSLNIVETDSTKLHHELMHSATVRDRAAHEQRQTEHCTFNTMHVRFERLRKSAVSNRAGTIIVQYFNMALLWYIMHINEATAFTFSSGSIFLTWLKWFFIQVCVRWCILCLVTHQNSINGLKTMFMTGVCISFVNTNFGALQKGKYLSHQNILLLIFCLCRTDQNWLKSSFQLYK